MSDDSQNPNPLSRTVYPFPKSGEVADNQAQTVEASAQEYFQALAEAEDGFFPIGYNGQWHGGIHFGKQTGTLLAQGAGLRCIADGQVIAYRIDEDYPTVKYKSCPPATYSKGFVLVRHR
ncbi:MAG: calcium-binding protein, partial [Luteimonas sp.]